MPDDPNAQPAGDPPAGDPPAADPPADPPAGGGDDLPEGAKKALAAARKDAKEAQKRASELEARLKEIDDRDKTEAQKAADAAKAAEARAEAAEAKVARISRDGWILAAAAAAKFLDPDDAVALLRDEELEDASDAKRAIEKLAKAKPHLVGVREATAGSFSGGQRGGGGTGSTDGGMNDFMRERLGIRS